MFISVIRSHFIGKIAHRTSHQIEIIHKERWSERKFQVHRSASKFVVGLHSLHVYRFLYCCLSKVLCIVFLYQQTAIDQTVGNTVVTVNCNQVLSLFQCGHSLFRQFGKHMFFSRVTGIHHLHAIHIDDGVIVVRIFQIYIFTLQVVFNIRFTAYPDILFSPLGLGCTFIFHSTESTFSFFPCRIIKVGILPAVSRFLCCILSCPSALFRGLNQRKQLKFFRSHETVNLSVYLGNTQEREVLTGPVFHRSVIQIIRKRPGTGVRVNHHQRIGRCTHLTFFTLDVLRCPTTAQHGSCTQEQSR